MTSPTIQRSPVAFFETTITASVDHHDEEKDDTDSFERAIQLIESHGGGRLIVSGQGAGGGHYRIRPINLTSHLILFLMDNVTLSAISSETTWPVIPPLPSYGRGRVRPGPRYTSLLHGFGLTNVTIQGSSSLSSVIDGQGHYWWKQRRLGRDKLTPGHLVEFMHSRDIRMYNLRLINSPFWTNHFFDCDGVHVNNVHVYAPQSVSNNTDGWDPDSSRNVLIENSSYDGFDDCVSIKSGWDCFGIAYAKPSINITIRDLTCHGRYAGIAIGSEMSGGVVNVTVQNVTFTEANSVAKIKVGNTRGGFVRHVRYNNLRATGQLTKFPIHIDMYHFHNNPNPECGQDWRPKTLPDIDDISFDGIYGLHANLTTKEVFHFVGMPEQPIKNVFMENVYFPAVNSDNDPVSWNCSGVQGAVRNNSVEPWPPCPEFKVVEALSSTTQQTLQGTLPLFQHICYAGFLLALFLLSSACSKSFKLVGT